MMNQESKSGISDKVNFFNIINKNYPEAEATRRGLNIAVKGNYKEEYLSEKAKEVGVIHTNASRPDFSDLGIGK